MGNSVHAPGFAKLALKRMCRPSVQGVRADEDLDEPLLFPSIREPIANLQRPLADVFAIAVLFLQREWPCRLPPSLEARRSSKEPRRTRSRRPGGFVAGSYISFGQS